MVQPRTVPRICSAEPVEVKSVHGVYVESSVCMVPMLKKDELINEEKTFSLHAKMDGNEEWVTTKSNGSYDKQHVTKLWHIPSREEVAFVEDIVDEHLTRPLKTLKRICEEKDGYKSKYAGQEKEHLRVLLLRVEGALCGLGSCLPDFITIPSSGGHKGGSLTIVGAAGATVGTSELRQETANVVHQVCDYILKNRGDDSILLKILVSIIDLVGNYGSVEYHAYLHMKGVWDESARLMTEPCTNFINNTFSSSKRRPWWLVVERAFVHNLWRASQSGYRCFKEKEIGLSVPSHIFYLLNDLLKLSLHSYNSVRSDAGRNLKNMLQRYPSLVKKCMPLLTKTLRDPIATKESALGSCEILMSRPVIRHLRQDWNGLNSFLLALLGSAHQESVEAQDAINELFIVFNTSFGGVPVKAYTSDGENEDSDCMTYTNMISYVKDLLKGESITIHWRYNLMAHGILLFLVLPATNYEKPLDDTISNLRYSVAGGFLKNLKSELPPLRPLSVIALLFLLEATPRCDVKSEGSLTFAPEEACNVESNGFHYSMANVLDDQKFGENVVNKLAIDRHSGDEDGYSSQNMSDAGITAFMPTYMREWPHTKTWDADMQGDQFSPTFAKLFKRLVQKFGLVVLKVLHGPLEAVAVSTATDDKGKQCIAAEIMAGLLHSDASCVLSAWEEWISALFQRFLVLPTLDSASEWAACIRFAVGGKGRNGRRIPLLRPKVLQCVAQCLPEKSSSTLIARRLMFLRAALVELLPAYSSVEEITFQSGVLNQVLGLRKHSSPQVRRFAGSVLCILLSNLHLYARKHRQNEAAHVEDVSKETCMMLMNDSMEATKNIINAEPIYSTEASSSEGDDRQRKRMKESVREMETILYFLVSAILSGRADTLMTVIITLIYPALSLQETSEKDLSALARAVMRFLQWQPFPVSHLSQVVQAALTAAQDINWHTRVAFLTFLQPFMYRHRFILINSDLKLLWDKVVDLLSDPQLEVREVATKTLSGMMKGAEMTFAEAFRERVAKEAALLKREKGNGLMNGSGRPIPCIHGIVLGLSAVILSVPYDIPRWLPDMITLLADFSNQPWPIRGTVRKTISDFRHTHSDMWEFQKEAFTEQQLEVLSNLTSSATYFA
ncbi:hypothetical protein L7F22_014433 [Adiantum nelumboides]|nr:hypothetical protein [Adiantum nelumboides]